MIILVYLFIILAIALILMSILGFSEIRLKRTPLPIEPGQIKLRKRHPSILARFPFSQRLLEKFKLEVKIKNRLDAAHLKLTAVEFFNLKLAAMLVFPLFTALALGKSEPLALLVSCGLGYLSVDIWLNRKIRQRKYAIARLLPETVDLLGLCVEVGLDFTMAVKWIIEKTTPNPIIEELAFVLEEIKWGKPRAQALKDMSKRLNIPEISSFVQTLVQAERMGTPVAEAFAILSEDSRLQRFHRGERLAVQAPLKILIPLIFCILPVIAIVVGGPIFLQFTQGNLFAGFGR